MIIGTKKILGGLLSIWSVVIAIIVFSADNIPRNITMVLTASAFFIVVVFLLNLVIEKIGLIWQCKGKKAFFLYILAINFFALSLSEFFFEPLNYNIVIYLLIGLLFLYPSLKNYSLNNERFERDYDFLYTLIVALLITIIKKSVEYFAVSKTYTHEESIVLILDSVMAISAVTIFYLIVEYMNNRTQHNKTIYSKSKEGK